MTTRTKKEGAVVAWIGPYFALRFSALALRSKALRSKALRSKALRTAHDYTANEAKYLKGLSRLHSHLAKQDGGLSSRDFCSNFWRQKKSGKKLLGTRFLA